MDIEQFVEIDGPEVIRYLKAGKTFDEIRALAIAQLKAKVARPKDAQLRDRPENSTTGATMELKQLIELCGPEVIHDWHAGKSPEEIRSLAIARLEAKISRLERDRDQLCAQLPRSCWPVGYQAPSDRRQSSAPKFGRGGMSSRIRISEAPAAPAQGHGPKSNGFKVSGLGDGGLDE